MGNNSPSPSQQNSQISHNEFLTRSSSIWTYREKCLYYSTSSKGVYDRYCVTQRQLDLSHPLIKRYFDRLKMMDKYLQNGNLYLPIMCMADQAEECGCREQNNVSVSLYYEPFEIYLADEVKARRLQGQIFKQAELWYILYNLLNAIRRFEPFCEKSGRIGIDEVLLNIKGQIRLKCNLSFPLAAEQNLPNLLSPEELQAMRVYFGREINFNRYIYKQMNINPNICQTFSLAILILSLADSTPPESFYLRGMSVNGKVLGDALGRLGGRYSRLLSNLLSAMLSGYQCRPLPSQIFEVFSQYQREIMGFVPFRLKPDLKASMINILK